MKNDRKRQFSILNYQLSIDKDGGGMELKPGYKQTDVGVIPEDWDAVPLRRTCRAIYRGASPRPIGDSRWFDQGSDIGWVRISDVTRSRRYLRETTQRLSEEGIKRSRFIPRGSLIMSICATVGRPIETAVNTCIHDGFVVFEKPGVDQGFLYHVLCDLEHRWATKGQTGSQMNLNTNLIKITSIPLPPTEEEQRAIATALSDVDALLDGLDRLIAKKRDLKQAAMQQLLTGKARLPGGEGEWQPLNTAKDSTLKARIGWQGLTTAEYLESGQYALVTGTNFFDGKIDWDGCHFVEKERYDQDRYIQLQINDVLLTKDGTIGKAAFVDQLPYPATLNSGVFVIRPKNGSYVPKYFFYVLRSQIFVDFLNKLQAGSTISHLYQKDFVNFEFIAPVTVEEQSAIVTILSDMDAEIAALKQRRNKTKDIKQAMMQELLTGKTRLVKPAI